jgi:hypothetical protein
LGSVGGSRQIGPFTVETSQVGGPDVLGQQDTASRTLTGIASTLAFGTIGGGAGRQTGIASTVAFGVPVVDFGDTGQFGFGAFGHGTFGGASAPVLTPGQPFTVGTSLVGSDDILGGTPQASAQSAQVGAIASTVAFGTINQPVYITGIASTLHFGTFSIRATPVSAGVNGIASTLRFGAPGIKFTITGIASTLHFGAVGAEAHVVGIASTVQFGTVSFTFGGVSVSVDGIASTVAFGLISQPVGADTTSVALVVITCGATVSEGPNLALVDELSTGAEILELVTNASVTDVLTHAGVYPSMTDATVLDVNDLATV